LTIAPNDFLDVSSLGGTAAGSVYLIATSAGTLTGTFDHVTAGYTVSYATPHEILLTAVPEPSSLTVLGLGAARLLARRRRCVGTTRLRRQVAWQAASA